MSISVNGSGHRPAPFNTFKPVINLGSALGLYSARRSQKEDIPQEETSTLHGRQGIEGRHQSQYVLSMRKRQEGASVMSILRQR